jgi:hypothetical protein
MNLSLRKTVIGGDRLKDDYCVIHEGRSVGRIRLADEQSWQGVVWTWNVNVTLPIPSWYNGSADNLEAAKDEFKAAWERFYAILTPEDIVSWHRTEDLANANASCDTRGERSAKTKKKPASSKADGLVILRRGVGDWNSTFR